MPTHDQILIPGLLSSAFHPTQVAIANNITRAPATNL